MNKCLFIAEADKIQDFIFRASRLSEVVGGSQLLTRFCDQVVKHLLTTQEIENNLLVNDGGKFVVIFDNEQKAIHFGDKLAETYRRVADGSLTIAIVPYNNRPFPDVYKEADKVLRKAKQNSYPPTIMPPHLPYLTICASCGIGLGVTHEKLYDKDDTETPNYLCQACKTKFVERQTNVKTTGDDYFLWPFIEEVGGDSPRHFDWTTRPLHVSEYDPRRYVAYLIADGNDMGKIFGQCDETQIKALSKEMLPTLRSCLIEPTHILKKQNQIEGYKIPVLPLIIGGDDLFALLPAPWALSFALEFSQHYHEKLSNLLKKLNLFDATSPPTVSIAVVICKETYPHTLAHQISKQRLDYAKQVSKSAGGAISTVDFQVVVGGQITTVDAGKVRPTVRPYLVRPNEQTSWPEEVGIPLQQLVNQRFALKNLPKKRLAQLRSHFDQLPENAVERQKWAKDLERVVKRISLHESDGKIIDQALTDLGKSDGDRLYPIKRPIDDPYWSGHGLPDLLQMWNFAFDLNRNRDDYEG